MKNEQSDSHKIQIKHIDLMINVNATENSDKVKSFILSLLPNQFDEKQIEISNLTGAYGNPIITYKIRLVNPADEIKNVIDNLSKKIHEEDKKYIYRNLTNKIDEKSTLFLRFKKIQLDSLELSNKSDVLKVEIKFFDTITKSSNKINIEDIQKYLMQVNLISE